MPAVLGCQVSRLLRGRAAPGSPQPEGRWTPCAVTAEVFGSQTKDVAGVSCSVSAVCRLWGSEIWSCSDVLPSSGWR